jgi:hypothetical protein
MIRVAFGSTRQSVRFSAVISTVNRCLSHGQAIGRALHVVHRILKRLSV